MPSHLIYSFARVGGMKTRRPVSRFSSYQGPDFRQESEAKRKLAFSSCLKDLACRLQIQDKIYSEITMARNGSIRKDQLNADKMLLLLATIYESARLVPAGSLLQRCSLTHDLNLKSGVTIPAGAGLVVPVQLVQMDDCSWGSDANEFNPYRFLSKPGKGSDIVLNKSVSDKAPGSS